MIFIWILGIIIGVALYVLLGGLVTLFYVQRNVVKNKIFKIVGLVLWPLLPVYAFGRFMVNVYIRLFKAIFSL